MKQSKASLASDKDAAHAEDNLSIVYRLVRAAAMRHGDKQVPYDKMVELTSRYNITVCAARMWYAA